MRADKNWEDPVGKKLFDYEGELSPQSWENIRKRIKPRRPAWQRWAWLPALLLLISIPLTLVLRQNSGPENQASQPIASSQKTQSEITARSIKKEVKISETSRPEINFGAPAIAPAPPSIDQPEKSGIGYAPTESADAPKLGKPEIIAGVLVKKEQKKLPENSEENPEISRTKTVGKTGKRPTITGGLVAGNIPVKSKQTVGKTPEKVLAKEQLSLTRKNNTETTDPTSQTRISRQAADQNKGSAQESKQGEDTGSIATILDPEAKNKPDKIEEMRKNDALPADQAAGSKPDSASVNLMAASPLLPPDSTQANQKTKEGQPGKFRAFAIYASPQYTFQRVTANRNDEVMILRMNNRNQFESARLGFEIGFRGMYELAPKVILEAGANFAQIRQHLSFTTVSNLLDTVVTRQQNGQIRLDLKNQEESQNLLFKYYFGGIYSGLAWQVTDSWQLAGGAGANFMLGKSPDEKTVPIRTNSLNPYLSAGLRYQVALAENVFLQAGPTVQYYVRPVQKTSAFYTSKLTTFGFSVGLVFRGKSK